MVYNSVLFRKHIVETESYSLPACAIQGVLPQQTLLLAMTSAPDSTQAQSKEY
jgi:hypothetical protein